MTSNHRNQWSFQLCSVDSTVVDFLTRTRNNCPVVIVIENISMIEFRKYFLLCNNIDFN